MINYIFTVLTDSIQSKISTVSNTSKVNGNVVKQQKQQQHQQQGRQQQQHRIKLKKVHYVTPNGRLFKLK